jgi:hypothetical protein
MTQNGGEQSGRKKGEETKKVLPGDNRRQR